MSNLSISAELEESAVTNLLKTITIPPLPKVVSALLAEVQRPDIDFHKINTLISSDIGLSASLMKSANSPFFGLRTKVQTVQQASSLLGLKNILNIVHGLALQQALSTKGINIERFWDHSNQHAMVSALITHRVPGVKPEDAYTFGLFHDCGIPLLMQRFPDFQETLDLADSSTQQVCTLENERYGTNHTVVGAILARNWQLPPFLISAIREHHNVEVLTDLSSETAIEVHAMTAISLLAHHLISGFFNAPEEAEWLEHGASALKLLGFDDDELDELRNEVNELLSSERTTAN